MPVGEHVVGPGRVAQSMLEVDAAAVRQLPAHVGELGVDLGPGEGFGSP